MSFTLATLKTAIQDYTDNSETTFVTHLPTFIKAAEEKILNVDIIHSLDDRKNEVDERDIEVKVSIFSPFNDRKRKSQRDRKKRIAHNFKAPSIS